MIAVPSRVPEAPPARASAAGPASASPRAGGSEGAAGAAGIGRPWSDEVLASRAAGGDRAAFAELVGRYEGRIFRFALVRLRNADDAADVAQEVFCRAWRGLGRFDPGRSFATWILTIARRQVIDTARARQRRGRDAARERERLGARDGRDDGPDLPDAWGVARRVLDARAFELLWLRYAESRTPAEIARITGRTGVSVRVGLHRARRAVGQAMGDEPATEVAEEAADATR